MPESRPASANSAPIIAASSVAPAPAAITNSVGSVCYLGHIGAGGNAIAAAASQAIAATQSMQQGRRSASLKASYEAINTGGVHAAEFSRELAGAAQTAIAAIQETTKKHKKYVGCVKGKNKYPLATKLSLIDKLSLWKFQSFRLEISYIESQILVKIVCF